MHTVRWSASAAWVALSTALGRNCERLGVCLPRVLSIFLALDAENYVISDWNGEDPLLEHPPVSGEPDILYALTYE